MAKKRRLITRRRTKWVGTVCVILIATVFVASQWFTGVYWWVRPNSVVKRGVGVRFGSVFVHRDVEGISKYEKQPDPDKTWVKWFVDPITYREFERFSASIGARKLPSPWLPHYSYSSGTFFRIEIPLWIPLLLVVLPTAYLWRIDRRANPWQCAKCRYDLRGLEGEPKTDSSESYPTICPECGTTKNP